ncbi:MAG: ATP-dependent helicase [Aureliella sp.]
MEFNTEQQNAIETNSRNVLVLAGAGTGKTRTIIGRAKHLLRTGTPPGRLAIMTFTRRAASEIAHRLSGAAGNASSGVFAGTFHRFCLRIMSSRRKWFGFEDLTVMDRDDQLQMMRIVRGSVVGKAKTVPQAAELLSRYSFARNTNQSPAAYLEKFTDHTPTEIEVIEKIFKAYRKRKRTAGYFDYDDILHRFARVLHDDETVRAKVSSDYDHILVDEMQDTNPLQWLILESLASHANLFCVGDDAQSIYAFRGADFRNVHSFSSRLEDAVTLKLEQNYRSTQPILDVANWLLDRSELDYNKRLRSNRPGGQRPTLLDFDSAFDEARWVVDSVEARYREGFRWESNMILCRTAASSRPIEAQLIEKKIPYRFVGGIGLLQTAHVRDILAPLRLIINYRDELAWIRYLTHWPRIGEVTATRVLTEAVGAKSSVDALAIAREKLPNRPEIFELLDSIADGDISPSVAIERAAEGLEPLLASKYDDWEKRQKDFGLLMELAKRHRTLSGFVETYTLDPVAATEVEEEDDLLTLITVHSAKGTEADVCFVVAAHSSNYPHSRSQGDDEAVEEERRVLYVALTRAREELVISRSPPSHQSYRRSWGVIDSDEYFLERVPSKLVDATFVTTYGQRSFYDDDEDDVIG